MLFSSPTFFAFFLGYFLLHLAVPARYRIDLIICGSTVFYAWWKLEYAWLPNVLMLIAYGGNPTAAPAAECRPRWRQGLPAAN